ncbi:hypothetical protein N0V85_001559 [Neurospora sp. IMI 360204]|nr:hypothetical protein N0V85_001559 [Neurospora sp. IMI 360204]
MFSSLILSGAVLAMFQALPTTLAFPTNDTSTNPILEARMMNGREILRFDCDNPSNGGFTKWGAKYVFEGIKHLNEVSGKPKNGPGPQNCGRALRVDKELNSYAEIAWAAQEIQKKCQYGGVNNNGGYLKGAVYMKDQWSVIVRFDGVNC